jgi:hypothetical protein
MIKTAYRVTQNNNALTIIHSSKKELLYSSLWYMEFGKTCSEIKNLDGKKIYTITKKFQFWKWRMVYLIRNSLPQKLILISQNTRNTVFKIEIENNIYEVKIHYNSRKSIYKNNKKIVEIDSSFSDKNYTEAIKVLQLENENLKITFLIITCLLIGETELHTKKVMMKSQNELEKNEEPWS